MFINIPGPLIRSSGSTLISSSYLFRELLIHPHVTWNQLSSVPTYLESIIYWNLNVVYLRITHGVGQTTRLATSPINPTPFPLKCLHLSHIHTFFGTCTRTWIDWLSHLLELLNLPALFFKYSVSNYDTRCSNLENRLVHCSQHPDQQPTLRVTQFSAQNSLKVPNRQLIYGGKDGLIHCAIICLAKGSQRAKRRKWYSLTTCWPTIAWLCGHFISLEKYILEKFWSGMGAEG